MTIIWCMVREIPNMAERHNILSYWTIFCLFIPLTTQKWKKILEIYHLTHVYHKWQSYNTWFLGYQAWKTKFFVILDCFLPFYPPNNPKNQNFEKMKKASGDIIILHKCTKNDNHMMYDSWDMKHDGQNFLSFCPFTP